jgi:hypothetical protein
MGCPETPSGSRRSPCVIQGGQSPLKLMKFKDFKGFKKDFKGFKTCFPLNGYNS